MPHVLKKHSAEPQQPEAAAQNGQPAEPQPASALDALVSGGLEMAVMQMLWQRRHEDPSLSMKITEKDAQGLQDCLAYLKVEGQAKLVRRPGYVSILMVEKGSGNDADGNPGNAITPVENNQSDYDLATAARLRLQAKEEIGPLARRVANMANAGEFSASDINDLCLAALRVSGVNP